MPTLTACRRAFQQALGPFVYASATAGSTTTATLAPTFLSSLLPNDNLTNMWVFSAASAHPKVRRVASLDHSTGIVTFDGAFGTAVAAATILEFSARIPAASQNDTVNGLNMTMGAIESINEGLRHLLVETNRTLTLVSGQRDYTLSDLFLLNRQGRVTDVYEGFGANNNGDSRKSVRDWELLPTAGGNVLRFKQPYRFTGSAPSVEVQAMQPASTYLNTGAVWADSTLGLVSETDLCWPEINDVVQVALVPAYRTLMATRTGADRAHYAALYANQVNVARRTHNYDHSDDMDPSVPVATPAQPQPVAAP